MQVHLQLEFAQRSVRVVFHRPFELGEQPKLKLPVGNVRSEESADDLCTYMHAVLHTMPTCLLHMCRSDFCARWRRASLASFSRPATSRTVPYVVCASRPSRSAATIEAQTVLAEITFLLLGFLATAESVRALALNRSHESHLCTISSSLVSSSVLSHVVSRPPGICTHCTVAKRSAVMLIMDSSCACPLQPLLFAVQSVRTV